MGKKILYCDFTGNNKSNDYDDMIMFKKPDYESFEERLNQLIKEPYSKYRERTKKYASYVMNNDINFPSHLIIRDKINSILKSNLDQ